MSAPVMYSLPLHQRSAHQSQFPIVKTEFLSGIPAASANRLLNSCQSSPSRVFVRARGAVLHALGLAIGLIPNNIGAQIPTLLLQGKRELPRYTYKIFGLEAIRCLKPDLHGAYIVSDGLLKANLARDVVVAKRP